jgi:hypothetical protein
MLRKRLVLHNYSDKNTKSPISPNLRNNKHITYSLKFPNFNITLHFLVPSLLHYLESYDHVGITGPFKRHIVRLSALLERRALSEITRRHQNISETARSHYPLICFRTSSSDTQNCVLGHITTFWTRQLVETTGLSVECRAVIEEVLRCFYVGKSGSKFAAGTNFSGQLKASD